jgi:hypothetical protein
MAYSPDSSTTGFAITGFTTPAYTLVTDRAPTFNSVKHVVSALTGTQGTASANSASKPFSATFFKPQVLRALPPLNSLTGQPVRQVPVNQYKLAIDKGGLCAANVYGTARFRGIWDIPAGMETYAPDEIKALIAFLIGLLTEEGNDIYDTLVTGNLP